MKGGDLRSIGEANNVVKEINNQDDFDNVFRGLFHSDRKVVMRTADVIEKTTIQNPKFLLKHKKEILALCNSVQHIELKWHLALFVSRLSLTEKELGIVWQLLTKWATDNKESRIVRVNSLQSLYNLLHVNQELEQDFKLTINEVTKDNIPSINARIRKFGK